MILIHKAFIHVLFLICTMLISRLSSYFLSTRSLELKIAIMHRRWRELRLLLVPSREYNIVFGLVIALNCEPFNAEH